MGSNPEQSGTHVGIWEGIHKAFQIVDKSFPFDLHCIILQTSPNDVVPYYFINEEFNTHGRPSLPSTFESIHETVHNTLANSKQQIITVYNTPSSFNQSNINSNMSVKQFISIIEQLVHNSSNRKAYFLQLLNYKRKKTIIYAILIFNNHDSLPNPLNDRKILKKLHSIHGIPDWERSPLIHALFLTSVIELRDKWRQFTKSYLRSAFTCLNEKELLHRAASYILNTLVIISIPSDNYSKFNYFYSNLDAISRIGYEKREPRGVLLVLNSQELQSTLPNLSVRFNTKVPLSNHKAARKVIEMSSKQMTGDCTFILTDGIYLYGIGIMNNTIPDNFIKVSFEGFDHWQVDYKQQSLFKTKHGIPHISRPLLTQPEFEQQMKGTFLNNELTSDGINTIYSLVRQAIDKASHGALIVVCNQVQQQVERLANQATRINPPTYLDSKILQGIFSIDGAILLDTQGICYAIGVILDGQAGIQSNDNLSEDPPILEDSARGSRYNSSVRYVNTLRKDPLIKVVAIVISEDNQVDIV